MNKPLKCRCYFLFGPRESSQARLRLYLRLSVAGLEAKECTDASGGTSDTHSSIYSVALARSVFPSYVKMSAIFSKSDRTTVLATRNVVVLRGTSMGLGHVGPAYISTTPGSRLHYLTSSNSETIRALLCPNPVASSLLPCTLHCLFLPPSLATPGISSAHDLLLVGPLVGWLIDWLIVRAANGDSGCQIS